MAINTFAGCSIRNDKNDSKITIESGYESSFLDDEKQVPSTPPISIDDFFVGDSSEVVGEEVNVGNSNIDIESEIKDTQLEVSKQVLALYDRLFVSGCDMNLVNDELMNILLVKMVGIEVTEEQRVVLFNTLNKTVEPGVDVMEYYYPLAIYVHMTHCQSMLHLEESNGSIVCDSLKEKLSEFKIESFDEYVTRRIYENGSLALRDAIERLYSAGYSLSDVSVELDTIYRVCTVPTGIDEDIWNTIFAKLLTTTNEYENVCAVYYDLALFVHRLTCEYTHYVNMFGVTECQAVHNFVKLT